MQLSLCNSVVQIYVDYDMCLLYIILCILPCAAHAYSWIKGNVAVYKDLNLKDISHVSTVKECDYRSVARAGVNPSFAVAVLTCTYIHVLVQRYSGFREQEKIDRRQTRA